MAQPAQPPAQVGRLINLIPVGLKEAAIDSPTSRASIGHFSEQVELTERWLEEYLKATNRLIAEAGTLDNVLTFFNSHAVLPTTITESMLDHDYSLLAMKRNQECARDYWMSVVSVVKKLSPVVVEPVRSFLHNEVRAFKDIRRTVEQTQKNYDNLQAKFAAQGKSKEPSSLREDAFQLHEAKKLYLKASMDFFTTAPQLRFAMDKLIVRVFTDQWREMRFSRDTTAATFQRSAQEMDRVRGWAREMETNEKVFRKELIDARKQLEDAAELRHRPSRELEDYALSTTPQAGNHGRTASAAFPRSPLKTALSRTGEKQGWLFLRTYTGKPTRTHWVKRWAFLRNGVFGWLIQSPRGGVEESERIGVLLLGVRPAPSEDRRFCFELKTNKNTILLQAETQVDLLEWTTSFEAAKSKALEDPGAIDNRSPSGNAHPDPAFAISAPPVPEFGTLVLNSLEAGASDENSAVERANTLPVPAGDDPGRESADVIRRSTGMEREESRDPASRILSKLDIHRKNPASSQTLAGAAGGGIASLIAASHGSMPVGPGIPFISSESQTITPRATFALAVRDMPPNSLAPSTLTNPPAPTSLSKTAVVVAGERGISAATSKSGIPNGILANIWGSSSTSSVNRLEREDLRLAPRVNALGQPSSSFLPAGSPSKLATSSLLKDVPDFSSMSTDDAVALQRPAQSRTPSPGKRHRSTISVDDRSARETRKALGISEFPNYYPVQLKTQDAQFRLLFPSVHRDERLVLVFRATWNPESQEFPGRIYITDHEIYLYSNHLGLVLTSSVALSAIDEVTAAPGRDCDFIFLHTKSGNDETGPTRITIKTFLEPLKLLQKRLSFLVRNASAEAPLSLEDVVKELLSLESEASDRSPSLESWDDVAPDTPGDYGVYRSRNRASTLGGSEYKAPIRVDRSLGGGQSSLTGAGAKPLKFKLPAQPVNYEPAGVHYKAVEKLFDISPKALYHIMFGDKSALWQLLQYERRAQNMKQGPWVNMGEGRLRRDFDYNIPLSDFLGREQLANVRDYQIVDVQSDHLCYVVTDKRTAWHLPYRRQYRLVSKIVITHLAKGRCKLAVFVKVEWLRRPWFLARMIEAQALRDLELDALDLADLVSDQVRRLGAQSGTTRAIQIFGQVGQSTEITQLQIDTSALNLELRRRSVQHTIATLLVQGLATGAVNAVGTILETVSEMVSWMWKTYTAHHVLVAILLVSALVNGWYSSRAGLQWWHERNAVQFVTKLGVSPNLVMSKAIYINDLDDILGQETDLSVVNGTSTCFSIFRDLHQSVDLDAPTPPSAHKSQAAMHRVQRTRQKLGSYRHDLLVAMRVVNRIEQEVLHSEWERWVMEEDRRCRQIGQMLKEHKSTNCSSSIMPSHSEAKEANVERWYDDYCGSCAVERQRLTNI